MTTICADAQVLANAAQVLAARREVEPVLGGFSDLPLSPWTLEELRSWLDCSSPRAAAALDRLRASNAAAPHPSDARSSSDAPYSSAAPYPPAPLRQRARCCHITRPSRPNRPGRQS